MGQQVRREGDRHVARRASRAERALDLGDVAVAGRRCRAGRRRRPRGRCVRSVGVAPGARDAATCRRSATGPSSRPASASGASAEQRGGRVAAGVRDCARRPRLVAGQLRQAVDPAGVEAEVGAQVDDGRAAAASASPSVRGSRRAAGRGTRRRSARGLGVDGVVALRARLRGRQLHLRMAADEAQQLAPGVSGSAGHACRQRVRAGVVARAQCRRNRHSCMIIQIRCKFMQRRASAGRARGCGSRRRRIGCAATPRA